MFPSPYGSEEEALLHHESLSPPSSSSSSSLRYGTTGTKPLLKPVVDLGSRSVDKDVNPEDAVVGRNLGWTSAVIMIFSRMIGGGVCIFRTFYFAVATSTNMM